MLYKIGKKYPEFSIGMRGGLVFDTQDITYYFKKTGMYVILPAVYVAGVYV